MADKEKTTPKVYSPDITPYSFEGDSYFFGTVLSFLVAPIRLIMRVMHNIFILPADLQVGYARSLLIVSCIMSGIGVVDAMLYNKWPLIVSQPPLILLALWLQKRAQQSTAKANAKRRIEIDDAIVEEKCDKVLDDINKILESEETK